MPSFIGTKRALLASSSRVAWPFGLDGNLIVDGTGSLGPTYYALPAGATYDYNNVRVINGGLLETSGTTFSWTIIGAKTLFEVDAASQFNLATNSQICPGGVISTTAPDGTSLSFTMSSQSDGGAGGESGQFVPGGSDPNVYGPGGGGGALVPGEDAHSTYGGYGGYGESGAGPANSGYGGDVVDHNGGNGDPAYGESFPDQAWGAGGGGGFRGRHSQSVYIKTGTLTLANAPAIVGAAWAGGAGGEGGAATSDSDAYGGGGGGGGAGGNGPKIVIRYHTNTYNLVGRITYDGGTGGYGGPGGFANGLLSSSDGLGGQDGANGADGVLDVASY